MMALFTDDAVYIEPFSGEDAAVGIEQVRTRLQQGWEFPLPDLELEVTSMSVTADGARSCWTCRSPALPDGEVSGVDLFEFSDGKVSRLEVRFDE